MGLNVEVEWSKCGWDFSPALRIMSCYCKLARWGGRD
jgi:hypothetical protein